MFNTSPDLPNNEPYNGNAKKIQSEILLKDFNDTFGSLTLDGLLSKNQEFKDTESLPVEYSAVPVTLNSSEILIGTKPLVRRQSRNLGIVVDQNTENRQQAFKDIETSIENSPEGDEGVIFLKEIAKALSGYISRILHTNESIVGSKGTRYINTDIATDIIAYLDKENFQGETRDIHISNNIFYLQDNVLLLERIKQKLMKLGKNEDWKAILANIRTSSVL